MYKPINKNNQWFAQQNLLEQWFLKEGCSIQGMLFTNYANSITNKNNNNKY